MKDKLQNAVSSGLNLPLSVLGVATGTSGANTVDPIVSTP
jgi:hypothetical protein